MRHLIADFDAGPKSASRTSSIDFPEARFWITSCLPTTCPESCWLASSQYPGMLLTNSDLPSHAINQLLGIVADPSLKYRLDVLDLVNAF